MRVIPVIDLLGGVAVHGVGGRRHEYQPVHSPLCQSSEPLQVANAFRREYGLTRLYVADLDAIEGRKPNLAALRTLSEDGFELLVDAGLRNSASVDELIDAGAESIVAGSETMESLGALQSILTAYRSREVVFSLDLMQGKPIGPIAEQFTETDSLLGAVWATGVRSLLVLDIARVGGLGGVGPLGAAAKWAGSGAEARCYVGGGVRDKQDLAWLRAQGVYGVLIASALHSMQLTKIDVTQ